MLKLICIHSVLFVVRDYFAFKYRTIIVKENVLQMDPNLFCFNINQIKKILLPKIFFTFLFLFLYLNINSIIITIGT